MSEVARGDYRYWRDGQRQDIEEPWRLTRSDLGLVLTGQRRQSDRLLFDVEASYAGARCTGFRLVWHASANRTVTFALTGDTLEWQSTDADATVERVPTGTLLFPLLRAAMGPLVCELAATPACVVVPALHDPADAQFLQPLRSQRSAARVRESAAGLEYRYVGGEYGDAGCDCWIDSRGLLQRYRWRSAHGEWDVRLEDLDVAPDLGSWSAV